MEGRHVLLELSGDGSFRLDRLDLLFLDLLHETHEVLARGFNLKRLLAFSCVLEGAQDDLYRWQDSPIAQRTLRTCHHEVVGETRCRQTQVGIGFVLPRLRHAQTIAADDRKWPDK